jgi:hypothetical protein
MIEDPSGKRLGDVFRDGAVPGMRCVPEAGPGPGSDDPRIQGQVHIMRMEGSPEEPALRWVPPEELLQMGRGDVGVHRLRAHEEGPRAPLKAS